jgi:hypothetical protein
MAHSAVAVQGLITIPKLLLRLAATNVADYKDMVEPLE